MRTIHHELLALALSRASGPNFEKFAQAFYGAMLGREFVPIGGVHDGGADGLLLPSTFQSTHSGEILQATVQQEHRSKIRETVKRLREFGREVNVLLYATSQTIQNPDKEESDLSEELGCQVRIRDSKFFTVQINNSPQYVQAYDSYLSSSLDFLNGLGSATTISKPPAGLPARALCVFIGQEVDRRSANSQLLESLTDTLILWSLRDTDPQKGVFRTRDEILQEVIASLPASKQFIRSTIDARLEALASKRNTGGRAITAWHKDRKYCLPYETRELIKSENTEDEAQKLEVAKSIQARLELALQEMGVDLSPDRLVDACFHTLEKIFELQGLELSYFLTNDSDKEVRIVVDEAVVEVISGLALPSNQIHEARRAVLRAIQGLFYDSSDCERRFLAKMSRTYCLLFSLKNEPRVVEYFRGMSANFVLYVGSDLFIRAFSEHYLEAEDRMTENLFKILVSAGSTLILTDTVLDEVHSHIKATDADYRNNYLPIEAGIDVGFARHVPKILLRAYYYAKLSSDRSRRPKNWSNFVEQFCSYDRLHRESGRESLRNYMMERFGCIYEERDQTTKDIDPTQLEKLAADLVKLRGDREGREMLARNDVLLVLRVYQKRRELGEANKSNPFGYRTWWLTQETTVRKVTRDLVRAKGTPYIVRPEFLLNFIALNPNVEDVRRSFSDIFPSLLGVKLANRMKSSTFNELIGRMREEYEVDEARARAKLPELVDQLKAEMAKEYDHEFVDDIMDE